MNDTDKAWALHDLKQRLIAAQMHLDKVKSGILLGSVETAQARVDEFEDRLEDLK